MVDDRTHARIARVQKFKLQTRLYLVYFSLLGHSGSGGALHEFVLPYMRVRSGRSTPHHDTKLPLASSCWNMDPQASSHSAAAGCRCLSDHTNNKRVSKLPAQAILKSKSVLEILLNSDDGYSLVKAIAAE